MPGFFTYARVERALAVAFEVPPDQLNRMRAKLKSLQKQGIGLNKRVPGMRAEYTQTDVDRWLVGIALLNTCIDPAIAARTIEANWQRAEGATKPVTSLEEIVAKARETPDDVDGARGLFLFLQLHAVLDTAVPVREGPDETSGELVTIGYFHPVRRNKHTGELVENWKQFFSTISGSKSRVAIPLSFLIRGLDSALAARQEDLP
jgi:hypothetical protein